MFILGNILALTLGSEENYVKSQVTGLKVGNRTRDPTSVMLRAVVSNHSLCYNCIKPNCTLKTTYFLSIYHNAVFQNHVLNGTSFSPMLKAFRTPMLENYEVGIKT